MKQCTSALIAALVLSACGNYKEDKSSPPPPPPAPKPGGGEEAEFSTIKPLLQKNCAGGACHTSGGARDSVIQSADGLLDSSAGTKIQNGSMPPPNSAQAGKFAANEKTTILAFIAKYK